MVSAAVVVVEAAYFLSLCYSFFLSQVVVGMNAT
jgi:hypothetical protein